MFEVVDEMTYYSMEHWCGCQSCFFAEFVIFVKVTNLYLFCIHVLIRNFKLERETKCNYVPICTYVVAEFVTLLQQTFVLFLALYYFKKSFLLIAFLIIIDREFPSMTNVLYIFTFCFFFSCIKSNMKVNENSN